MQRVGLIVGIMVVAVISWWAVSPPPQPTRAPPPDSSQSVAGTRGPGLVTVRDALIPVGVAAAGTGRGRITGRVVDEQLRPAPGIRVVALPSAASADGVSWALDRRAGRVAGALVVTSDTEGRFLFKGLAEDRRARYYVRAEPPGPQVGSRFAYPVPSAWPEEIVLHVRMGGELRGQVLGADGRGVAALLSVQSVHLGLSAWRPPVLALRDQPTEADGSFLLVGVPMGPVRVSARVPGRVQVTGIRTHVPQSGGLIIRLQGEGKARVVGTIHDTKGAPLLGVRVRVDGRSDAESSTFNFRIAATSDADGAYEIRVPGPCRITRLRTAIRGFVPVEIRAIERPVSAAGETSFDLVLLRGGRIEGRVLSGTDRPLAGARVRCEAQSGGSRLHCEARSGRDGGFTLEGVPPGPHLLRAELEGFYAAPRERTATSSGRSRFRLAIREQVPVLVPREGATVRADIRLVAGVALEGRVVDEAGQPVAGARIAGGADKRGLRPWSSNGVRVSWGGAAASSDAEGKFRFPGVRAGTQPYWLQAQLSDRLSEPQSLQIVATLPPAPLELVLRRGGVLAGRTLTAEGRPLPGASLLLAGPAGGRRDILSDGAGRFKIAPLAPGRYGVRFAGPLDAESMHRSLMWGDVIDDLMLRATRLSRTTGFLLDAEGKPRAHTRLSFHGGERGERGYGMATTDEAGRFDVEGLPPGSYSIRADSGYIEQTLVAGSRDVRFVQILAPLRTVEGRVLDPAGHPLARGIIQARFSAPGRRNMSTGRSSVILGGRFSFAFRTADSHVRLRISDPLDALGVPIDIEPFEVDGLGLDGGPFQFELRSGGVLAGIVVDGEGSPASGVGVSVRQSGHRRSRRRVETGADGRFRLEGLQQGTVEITLRISAEFRRIAPRSVQTGETDLRFELQLGGVITGRVFELDGGPAAGVPVQAMPTTHPVGAWGQGVTAADGSFRLVGLDDDRDYRIRTDIGRPGGDRQDLLRVYSSPVRTGATNVEISLVKAVQIRGRVLDVEGQPVSGAAVVAYSVASDSQGIEGAQVEGLRMTRSEGGEGAFTIGPLAPGTYDVSASSMDPRVGRTNTVRVEAPAEGVTLRFGRNPQREGLLQGDDVANFRISWAARKPDGTLAHAFGQVSADGTFVIGSMVELSGTAYFYRRADTRYALIEGVRPAAKPLTVTLKEGLAISGRVSVETKAEAGRRVPFLGIVRALSKRFGFHTQGRIGPDGTFQVTGLPPGSYELRYHPFGARVGTAAQLVMAGAEGIELEGK